MRKYRTFIIAEVGVNHNGSLAMARELISVVKAVGADAVKFQMFKADQLTSVKAKKAPYQLKTSSKKENQLEMLKRLELSSRSFEEIASFAIDQKISFMASPFDLQSANFLASLSDAPIKIPSGEITNLPLLRGIGRLGREVILSTGMSYLGEVEQAIKVLKDSGSDEISLLHCVSDYPASPADTNLLAMDTMKKAFGLRVGFSDHSTGISIPIAAVAIGAEIIEKHITLDRSLDGPDHLASLEPEDFLKMVQSIREIEVAMGNGIKAPSSSEYHTRKIARRSLVANSLIKVGEMFTRKNVVIQRPGTGLAPSEFTRIIGRKALRKLEKGEVILETDLV